MTTQGIALLRTDMGGAGLLLRECQQCLPLTFGDRHDRESRQAYQVEILQTGLFLDLLQGNRPAQSLTCLKINDGQARVLLLRVSIGLARNLRGSDDSLFFPGVVDKYPVAFAGTA